MTATLLLLPGLIVMKPGPLELSMMSRYFSCSVVTNGRKKDHFELCPRTVYVVNVWPAYLPDKSNPVMYEEYCRAKLQLHHPYQNINDLQKDEDGKDIGWVVAYERCKNECDFHDEDPLMKEEDLESEEPEIEEEFEDEDETEEERILRDWQELARRGPGTRSTRSRLGQRDIDRDFDWKASYNIYGADNVKAAESYIDEQKWQTEVFDEEIPDVDISKLVGNQ